MFVDKHIIKVTDPALQSPAGVDRLARTVAATVCLRATYCCVASSGLVLLFRPVSGARDDLMVTMQSQRLSRGQCLRESAVRNVPARDTETRHPSEQP